MKGCRDRSKELADCGVLVNSYNTSVGTEVSYHCACEKQRLRGWKTAKCNRDRKWEPSDMPTCENDWLAPFSTREYVMLGIATACLFSLVVIIVSLIVRQHRKKIQTKKTSKRLKDRLASIRSKDPLDEIIQRERIRRESGEFKRHSLASERAKRGSQPFRVWNQDGSRRQKLMAWSLEDLIDEACEKLDLTPPLSVVLELDGKKIHNSEELFSHSGKLLVALELGQEWHPIRGQHNALIDNFNRNSSLRRYQSDDSYLNCNGAAHASHARNGIDGSTPEIAVSSYSGQGLEPPNQNSNLNSGEKLSNTPAMSVYSIQIPHDEKSVRGDDGKLPAVALLDERQPTKSIVASF